MWQSWTSCSNKILLIISLPCSPEQFQSFPGGAYRLQKGEGGIKPPFSSWMAVWILGLQTPKSIILFEMQGFVVQVKSSALHWEGRKPKEARLSKIIDQVQPGTWGVMWILPLKGAFLPCLEALGNSWGQPQLGKLAVALTSSQILWKPL